MAVLSAAIEGNGWVLAVRGTWGATSGAFPFAGDDRPDGDHPGFLLDPHGARRVQLLVAAAGFDRAGGQAVANAARSRTLVATKPLRRAFPNQAQLDETDHGGGERTVRLALSERVYAGNSVTQIAFAAGWKAGEGAALLAGVTNGSTRAAPLPISRWAQPSYTLVQGTTLAEVDVIVAAHHPEHFGAVRNQALAAMKLEATDGTTTKTFWFAGLRTSPQYGDNLRCWGGQIDLSGLTPGLITVHRTLYPWVGAARSTGAGHSVSITAGVKTVHDQPLHLCYDPSATRYAKRHVYVNAATGTTTVASVTVGTTLAGAKAGTAAATISVALQAIYNANVTLAAGNGLAGGTRSCDWMEVVLAPGVQTWGAQAVTTGFGSKEGRLIVRGDPDDANPRANCIWRSMAAAPSSVRNNRWWVQDLTLEGGEATLMSAVTAHFDNVEGRGKTGFESSTVPFFFSTPTEGDYFNSWTRSTFWKYGSGLSGGSFRAGLARNCVTTRKLEAQLIASCSKVIDPVSGVAAAQDTAYGIWGTPTTPVTDGILYQSRAMHWRGKLASFAIASGADTQASPGVILRAAVVNFLIERVGASFSLANFFSVGETQYQMLQDSVLEGVTAVGNRINLHNDSPVPRINLQQTGNVIRNCWMDWQATKHDVFATDGSLTGAWEVLYGVGFAANVHNNRNPTTESNFQHAFFGVNSLVNTNFGSVHWGTETFEKFVNDNSDAGLEFVTGGSGGGDYRPAAGSPALGRASLACVDVDLADTARGNLFAAGALNGTVVPVMVPPGFGGHAHLASAALLGWAGIVGPAAGRHPLAGSAGALLPQAPALAARGAAGRRLIVDREVRVLGAGGD